MSTAAIVDYGVGNLFSLTGALRRLGAPTVVTSDADAIRAADAIILPGVGAFGDAAARLRASGLVDVLDERIGAGVPLMGICLGMQLLFERSFEYGEHAGLGYLPGSVVPLSEAFARDGIDLKVPHMGWNALDRVRDDVL
ncbi:MAG: imidazole glycerol phosphate synthase subunit HisH, partial [Slackia sp.]|nr:imidazole glycerol phosphate synthase subunit HisH [Slackia sp.]